MIRTRKQWETYLQETLDASLPVGQRGFITGDNVKDFYENGLKLLSQIKELSDIDLNNKSVLDIGCANGRLPVVLDGEDINIAMYTGFDVMKVSIDNCRKSFDSSEKYNFIHLPFHNARYARHQKQIDIDLSVLAIRPYDLIVMNSVFTHTGHSSNVPPYLREIVKLMSDDTKFYATWFKSPPNKVSFNERKSVYPESFIRHHYTMAGLEIVHDTGGNTVSNHNHWRILARKIN